MSGPRQTIQYTQQRLALASARRGEPLAADRPGTEPPTAKRTTDRPATEDQLMEEVCDRSNLEKAWKRVRRNKGGPGVDGLTIDDTATYLREHWPTIRAQLLTGTYTPQPVKRVDVPKPDGGVRRLGVPCVVDRLIQQALLQVLQGQWDPTFSEHSYGFRPGRSAHQAVAQAQAFVADGYDVVVDIDLEKFFDRVNQDRLMARVAERVSDKRVLTLIRALLRAGVLEDGMVRPTEEGTPQGGPITPRTQKVTSRVRVVVGVVVRSATVRWRWPRGHGNAVADHDLVIIDEDLFDDEAHDSLPLHDVERRGRRAQAGEKRRQSLGQAQMRGALASLLDQSVQLVA